MMVARVRHNPHQTLMIPQTRSFATMMVREGDADGMVSGATCTTANTIRPALQVLKTPQKTLVSSIFFMCLPDKVGGWKERQSEQKKNAVYGSLAPLLLSSPPTLAPTSPPRVCACVPLCLFGGAGAGPW